MTMIPRDIFPKFKTNIKLSTRQDGDGNEVEVEVRENEEQLIKFQEIVDLLVAAGYFRARIKGLSQFDKVVGGMTWCIETCNFDVDVDFLFQENSTIGQKIALTEKIVALLPKMKCPFGIEPHQIQGLDFLHIFPVIQWLVKTSMEFRSETFDFVRLNAVNQFNKTYSLETDNASNERAEKMNNNIKPVCEVYRPKRHYRLKKAPPLKELDRVQVTLLEYGYRSPVNDPNKITSQLSVPQETLDERKTEELRVEKLLKNMLLMDEQDDFGNLDYEEKIELMNHYAAIQAEMGGGLKSKEEKKLIELLSQNEILKERLLRLKNKKEKIENNIIKLNETFEKSKKSRQEIEDRFDQVMKGQNDGSNLKQLEEFIIVNENLREQEHLFKEQCQQELIKYQNMIKEATNSNSSDKKINDLEHKLSLESAKVNKLRLELAKLNRPIAIYQRKLDDIPSRAEIAQYQRRFLELYNQVATKQKDTKQYYTLYNTLDDTKLYILKEFSIINSILDNYREAMMSSEGKKEFIKQFENIVEGVKQTKLKVECRLAEEKQQRDVINEQLIILVEHQRKYIATVKQLSMEVRQYEALLAENESYTSNN